MTRLNYLVFLIVFYVVALLARHSLPDIQAHVSGGWITLVLLCAIAIRFYMALGRMEDMGLKLWGKVAGIVLLCIPFVCFIAQLWLLLTPTAYHRSN